ncbi:hypothetical protein JNL27_04190 [bacterium]|nr:hypothetical protein [bacterium]
MNFLRALAIITLLSGCSMNGSDDNHPLGLHDSLKNGETFSINGTVRYIDLEGGFYAVIGKDGQAYDPINLSESFQKDGLEAVFLVKIVDDFVSAHMFGIPVEIIQVLQTNN